MPDLEELVSIHVGQAGIQMGASYWELLSLEHSLSPDGKALLIDNEDTKFENMQAVFHRNNENNYTPRSIFIDSEPTVIDEIKSGSYRNLFSRQMMLNSEEDAANNYARGSYVIGRKLAYKMTNIVRKMAEKSDLLRSFILFFSSGGGSGSGLSALLLLILLRDYPKSHRTSLNVTSDCKYSACTTEPYNISFHNLSTVETCDISFLIQNESLYNMISKELFINRPDMGHVNRVLGIIFSNLTCPFRYRTDLRNSVADLVTNLVPYPRIRFPIIRYAPMTHLSKHSYSKLDTSEIVRHLFINPNQTVDVHPNSGDWMSSVINFQGLVSSDQIYNTIEEMKFKKAYKFVEWAPGGFKIAICQHIPTPSPMMELAHCDQSATMLVNTTAIIDFFKVQIRKFKMLYNRNAFVHWYLNEGMETEEFIEAQEECSLTIGDFKELSMSEKEIIELLDNCEDKTKSMMSYRTETSSTAKNISMPQREEKDLSAT